MNTMTINGITATVSYDSDIDMFRGEFVGLSGGADFYASNVEDLKNEGALSLKIYLEACEKDGIEPYKNYSGKFNLRIDPKMHEKLAIEAKAQGVSINNLVEAAISAAVG